MVKFGIMRVFAIIWFLFYVMDAKTGFTVLLISNFSKTLKLFWKYELEFSKLPLSHGRFEPKGDMLKSILHVYIREMFSKYCKQILIVSYFLYLQQVKWYQGIDL